MPLTLTILNTASLDNGSPASLVLDRRGALIGRAATNDWSLPDPSLHISSRHCEIRFADERYELHDISTNGTFLRGQAARLPGPHIIAPGDVFTIGQFEIAAALDEAAAAKAQAAMAAAPTPEWKGWSAHGEAASPVSESAWDRKPAGAAITGSGAMSQAWAPPSATGSQNPGWGAAPAAEGSPSWGSTPVPPPASPSGWGAPAPAVDPTPQAATGSWGAPAAPATEPSPSSSWGAAPSDVASTGGWGAPPPTPSAPPPSPSTWEVGEKPAVQGASEWSAPTAPPPPPGADDIWGKFAQSNVVDWARGGFGKPTPPVAAPLSPAPAFPTPLAAPPPSSGPGGWSPTPATAPMPPPAATSFPGAAATPAPPPPASAPESTAPQPPSIGALAQALGVEPDKLQLGDAGTLAMAGNLLRRLVSGLVVMLEARARAKSQLGAQGTSLEFAGNNPLKFARTPEQALAQLLNDPQRGFMGSDQAIEDAFKDLQAHQIATLAAMQGALRATLDRFSPAAIRKRAEKGGFLTKILPGAKDAALWTAYEREFSGVAQGSDEAFMDVFAKEFRKAYEEAARR